MDRNGKWRLSPAYDLTFSYDVTNKWLNAHQMTVNGKKEHVMLSDLLVVGEQMGLKKRKCMDIISKITTVVGNFEKYAMEATIKERTYSEIRKILDQNKVEI